MNDYKSLDIRVIIPALDEESAIAAVVASVPSFVREIIVVDNGSKDLTAERARNAGARVQRVEKAGYGRSCLAGIAAAGDCDIIVFMDGDGSDIAEEMAGLIAPIAANEADLVIGARTCDRVEKGALTPQQRYGNKFACYLMDLLWGSGFTDLGPFRAIRRSALLSLEMDNKTFGWTVEMQVRALKEKLRCAEIPVSYRKRIGISKISGTLKGVILASCHILAVIAREAIQDSNCSVAAKRLRRRQ